MRDYIMPYEDYYLNDIEKIEENGKYYFKLTYTKENTRGEKSTLVIHKCRNPFPVAFPTVKTDYRYTGSQGILYDRMTGNKFQLLSSKNKLENTAYESVLTIYQTCPSVKKMTISEIEKELGYSVEIVREQ